MANINFIQKNKLFKFEYFEIITSLGERRLFVREKDGLNLKYYYESGGNPSTAPKILSDSDFERLQLEVLSRDAC